MTRFSYLCAVFPQLISGTLNASFSHGRRKITKINFYRIITVRVIIRAIRSVRTCDYCCRDCAVHADVDTITKYENNHRTGVLTQINLICWTSIYSSSNYAAGPGTCVGELGNFLMCWHFFFI